MLQMSKDGTYFDNHYCCAGFKCINIFKIKNLRHGDSVADDDGTCVDLY